MEPLAAVTNSTILKGCRLGGLIDQFNWVCRMNHFNTRDPFHLDVGQKTTIWAHYEPRLDRDGDYEIEMVTRTLKEPVLWRKGQPKERRIQVENLILESGIEYPKGIWPTTGINILNFLVQHWRPVYLFGWFSEHSRQSAYNFLSYYHTVHRDVEAMADRNGFRNWDHNIEKDREFVDWLIKEGYCVEVI